MRCRLFVHITWTTLDRELTIDAFVEDMLRRLLPAIAKQERARIMGMGFVRNHVHLAVSLHPTTAIPRLMQRMKGGTSVLVNRARDNAAGHRLGWAKGYNIESVSPRVLPNAIDYVRTQDQRHPQLRILRPQNDKRDRDLDRS